MRNTWLIVLSAAALVISACGAAPESSPVEVDEAEHLEPSAICACHMIGLNGKLRCVTACPGGMVCGTSWQICVAPP